MRLSRRGFLASTAAVIVARGVPGVARRPKIILELVYDKSLGMMRAVEKVIW